MFRTILLAALLTAVGLSASARPRLRTEKGPDGKSLNFYVEDKDYPGMMTVLMNFSDVKNCDLTDGIRYFVVRNSGERLLTLRPLDNQKNIRYKLLCRFMEGAVDRMFDSTFVYRMPCQTGRPVRISGTVNILDKYREKKPREPLGYFFQLEKGDTVYAMRRGLVVDIKQSEVPAEERPQYNYTSRSAKITVEHADGTRAWYVNFDPDHVFVNTGDDILPGMPLGLAGTYDGERYGISVQLYRYESDPRAATDTTPVLRRLTMRFATEEGIVIPHGPGKYTPVMTDEMLTREMTKKERKKLRAGNK